MWPAIIGAAGSLIGGGLNALSGASARGDAMDMANAQMAQQREFATTGITWRANDAMKAYARTGIHPLALLGVQGPSYTPVNYVGSGDTSLGSGIAAAGQDISRGMLAYASREDKAQAVAAASAERNLRLEHMELQNQLLRSQIARINANPSVGVPIGESRAIPGQVDTTRLLMSPNVEVGPTDRRNISERRFANVASGGQAPVMSEDFQKATEDDWIGKVMWHLRNNLLPQFGINQNPPSPAPRGYHWTFDVMKGYILRPDKDYGYVRPRQPWRSIPYNMP